MITTILDYKFVY